MLGGTTRTGSLRLSARRGGTQPAGDRRRAETAADAVPEDRLCLRPFGGGPLPESRQGLATAIPGTTAHLPLRMQRQPAESHPGSLRESDQHHPGPSGNRQDADDPQHRGQSCGAGEDRAGRLEQQLGHRKRSRETGEAGTGISHRPAGQPRAKDSLRRNTGHREVHSGRDRLVVFGRNRLSGVSPRHSVRSRSVADGFRSAGTAGPCPTRIDGAANRTAPFRAGDND